MKKINYLFSAMGLLALAACSSDSDEEYGRDLSTARQIVPVTQISENTTRASQGLQATSIAKDVKVRFLVTEANSTTISNQSLLTSNGSNSFSESETNLYYPVSGSADIYGYAPATETTVSDLTADQTFEIQTDQSTDDAYLASDLLIGSKTGVTTPTEDNSYVVVTFKHALTKLNLNIEESLKPATVKINNTKTKCTFNLSTGAVTATGDAGSVTAATNETRSTRAGETSYKYSAIIIPQEFSTDAAMLEITTTDGDTYTFTPSAKMTAAGATEYTYNVTTTSAAKQVAMTLQSEVKNWESTDEQEAVVEKAERTAHVGDWYTAEGKYVDGETAAPSNAIGIVFNISDVPSGYQAYVSSIIDKGNTSWGKNVQETALSADNFVTTGSAAVASNNGLTLTGLLTNDYGFSSTITNFQSTYAAPTASNLSTQWFVPSVGEMILLAKSIYGGTITGSTEDATFTISNASAGYDNSTIQSRVAAALTAGLFTANTSTDFLDGGSLKGDESASNPTYYTISEVDASTVWTVTFNQSGTYKVQTQAKSGTARRTHLILLAK